MTIDLVRRIAPLAAAAALAACQTSAPHTMGAAAIMTGVAAGAAASSRASGGCWAICTGGLVCNPRTGWCEKPPPAPVDPCPPGASSGDPRCSGWPAPTVTHRPDAPAAGTGSGLVPATPPPPPPPAEASPGGPPKP
jgi:hypothetical protein